MMYNDSRRSITSVIEEVGERWIIMYSVNCLEMHSVSELAYKNRHSRALRLALLRRCEDIFHFCCAIDDYFHSSASPEVSKPFSLTSLAMVWVNSQMPSHDRHGLLIHRFM